MVTAETVNLKIDEIIIKNQGGANVAWISNNDKKLKVGSITHNGLGATSGQVGIYLSNTDAESSAEFGTIDISNVPGIAFRTYNTGKVKIGTLIAKNNREHARIQSHVTIDNVDGVDSLEIGVNFHDNFASGSSIGRCELTGTAGTGVNVGSDNISVPYAKSDGFALYGLHVPLGTDTFNNDYYEGANCGQGLRILSAGDLNMGVINLHDNTNGLIGSGGDASVSLEVGIDQSTQRFTTTLTVARTVTLTTTNAQNGDRFRISRTAAGAFNLSSSGTFNNKALATNEWMDYEFQGSGWYLTGFGSL